MLSKKLALLLAVSVVHIAAKDTGTTIAEFRIVDQKLPSTSKWFTNKTNQKIKIRWAVVDLETGRFYAQEPMVNKNGSIEIKLPDVAQYLDVDHGSLGYELKIEVCKVLNTPRQKWDETNLSSFKNGKKDLILSRSTFYENDAFWLLKDKSGNVDCKAVLKPKSMGLKGD